jgi:perosamine synthetase
MKIPQYNLDHLGGEYLLTEELEKKIANFLKIKHCIMVSSGMAALFIALRATGAKKVAIPNLTMVATAMAAELAGCEILLVSDTTTIPDDIDTYVHVSLNGRQCDIESIIRLKDKITIIEDSCQSFGSQHNNNFLGTFGKVGCFSFSPHKMLSAGNGGCIVTNNDEIAIQARRLKNFGRESGGGDFHEHIGYNFKFTDIQARFVLDQFSELEDRINRKQEIYSRYYSGLKSIMREHSGVPWFIDVYIKNRDELAEYLAKKEIGTRKMYPLISDQPPFFNTHVVGNGIEFSNFSKQGLWLPSSQSITNQEIDYVIKSIQDWQNLQK